MPCFTRAGYEVGAYRYYCATSRGIHLEGMLEDLQAAAAGTVVVLHACCHNPTGYDLTPQQWDRVIAVIKAHSQSEKLQLQIPCHLPLL